MLWTKVGSALEGLRCYLNGLLDYTLNHYCNVFSIYDSQDMVRTIQCVKNTVGENCSHELSVYPLLIGIDYLLHSSFKYVDESLVIVTDNWWIDYVCLFLLVILNTIYLQSRWNIHISYKQYNSIYTEKTVASHLVYISINNLTQSASSTESQIIHKFNEILSMFGPHENNMMCIFYLDWAINLI